MEKYPLEQVLEVKKDRVQKAEKALIEKKRALEIEMEKLRKAEAERDVVLNHHKDKLTQLRSAMDTGTTSDEVIQMKGYLKSVKEKLVIEEAKVKKQQEQVKNAEKQVELARLEFQKKRVELEKINLHKVEWKTDEAKELVKEEEKAEDEMSGVIHERERRKKKQ